MKRVLGEVREAEWSDIPSDVTSGIVLSLYGLSSQIVLVCKPWLSVVDEHKGWFERAKELYQIERSWFSPKGSWDWLKRLSELDKTYMESYSNYGGPGRNDYETIITSVHANDMSKSRGFALTRDTVHYEIHKALYYLDEYMPQDESSRLKNYIGRVLVAKFGRLFESYNTSLIPNLKPLLVFIREETSSILLRRNFHPRDVHISFQEIGHQYTLTFWCEEKGRFVTIKSIKSSENEDDNGPLNLPLKGVNEEKGDDQYYQLLSGTGFIGTLFPPFDADEAARNRHDRTISDEEIKKIWKKEGEDASREGTKMHLDRENEELGRPYDATSLESALAREYKAKIVNGKMRAYRTEWKIWDPVLMICGSVDILYEEWPPRKCPGRDPTKKYLILGDYKRSKEIKLMNPYQSGIPECSAVANAGDCNYMHYVIQLNLYKYILETWYDVVILQTFIIVLHPDQDHFIKMNLNPPPGFMDSILEYRRKTLAEKRASFLTG